MKRKMEKRIEKMNQDYLIKISKDEDKNMKNQSKKDKASRELSKWFDCNDQNSSTDKDNSTAANPTSSTNTIPHNNSVPYSHTSSFSYHPSEFKKIIAFK